MKGQGLFHQNGEAINILRNKVSIGDKKGQHIAGQVRKECCQLLI